MIVLFATPPEPPTREPSAMMVSILVHGVVCVFAFLIAGQPARTPKPAPQRYEVRIMELQPTPPQVEWYPPKPPTLPGQPSEMQASASAGSAGQIAAPHIPVPLPVIKQTTVTVIQPDAKYNLAIPQEAAPPQMMVWSARQIPVKKIVTPPQPKVAAITTKPSLAAPNGAERLADIRIAPTPTPAVTPLPPPSTTSPVTVAAAAPVAAHIPQTATKGEVELAPASVISLSDVQLKEGTVAVPQFNAISARALPGPLAPGQPGGAAQTGRGAANSKLSGNGSGTTPGNGAGNSTVAGTGAGSGNGVGAGGAGGHGAGGAGGGSGQGLGGGIGNDAGGAYTIAHVSLPRDGRFGVVVVGSSIAEDYPETVGIWSGRLAYTVYLHVGATKNWILQYSLPRSKDAAAAGSVVKLDAPWPYDILRPSIDPDLNADAIMVHGFVNTSGRFENLAVVFPNGLAEARFLLHALQQWQFRPAQQNGEATVVEVLLIIPEETD